MINFYTGYVILNGARVQIDFEASQGKSQSEIDSVFLTELGKILDFDYLLLSEREVNESDEHPSKNPVTANNL